MRALELAKVAAAAEALRVKQFARRQGIRVGLAVAGVIFMLAFLAMLHALVVVLLALAMPIWLAVLLVAVADLAIGGGLLVFALRDAPGRVELEAAAVRRQSLAEAKRAATSLATLGEVAGLAVGMVGKRNVRATRAGKAWMIADLASRFIRR